MMGPDRVQIPKVSTKEKLMIRTPKDWKELEDLLMGKWEFYPMEAHAYKHVIVTRELVQRLINEAKASNVPYVDFFLDTLLPKLHLSATWLKDIKARFENKRSFIFWMSTANPVMMQRILVATRIFYEIPNVPPAIILALNPKDIPTDGEDKIKSWLEFNITLESLAMLDLTGTRKTRSNI